MGGGGGGGDAFHGAQIKKKTSCQSLTKLNKVFKQIPSRFNTRIFHVYGQKTPSNPFSLTVCLCLSRWRLHFMMSLTSLFTRDTRI